MVRQAGAKLAVGLTMMGLCIRRDGTARDLTSAFRAARSFTLNEPCPDAKKIEIKQTKGVNYEGRGSGGAEALRQRLVVAC